MELLFSYGTLQLASVQLSTFGRLLTGTADTLPGYQQGLLKIEDAEVVAASGETHHPIVRFTGDVNDTVAGMVFQITAEELRSADAYEVDDYRRVSATLVSGIQAWVYVEP